jgi:Trypsin-like peptidase domain
MPPVDPLSTISLYVEVFFEAQKLSSATGFIVERPSGELFLFTSRHVLSGRRCDTGAPCSATGGVPNRIEIHHHHGKGFGRWKPLSYSLVDSHNRSTWLAHSSSRVDLAALPLGDIPSGFRVYPLDLNLASFDMVLRPGMPVFIIGFPLGLKNLESLPIWKTGHIASDPNTNYDHQRVLLVDATTRSGMSGSPVVCRTFGQYEKSDGLISIYGPPATKLVGVYSGRLRDNAEIGFVWKPDLIENVLSNGATVSHVVSPPA